MREIPKYYSKKNRMLAHFKINGDGATLPFNRTFGKFKFL